MRLKKTIPIALAGLLTLLFSCKKQDSNVTAPPDDEDCVQATNAVNGKIIEGKFIVAYDPGVVNARLMNKASLESYSEDVLQRNNIAPGVIENIFPGEPGGFIANLSSDEVAKLRADASVLAIEPDRVVALALCFTVASPSLITWNIHRTGYGNGIGKTAWIIDTGVDFDHPDLTVDVTRSRSFIPNELTADDQNGHGTHVAGIIGGMNNNFGVLGVASGATIVPLKVLNQNGVGSTSAIIQALGYINTNAAAGDVVNMSLGEDTTSIILNQQVQNTAARGIYIAIAAGNDHQQANKFSPGNTNGLNIYTVSAIDSLDNFAGFSNYGNDVVDYAAPGVRILSTYTAGRYAYMSGTSMATPHVAGLLLLKGRNITTSGFARNDPDGTADPIAHY